MINQIPNGKALLLNGKNNPKYIYKQAAKSGYTYIFTSPQITLSKKFEKNILNNSAVIDRLCLLAVDKIYLID